MTDLQFQSLGLSKSTNLGPPPPINFVHDHLFPRKMIANLYIFFNYFRIRQGKDNFWRSAAVRID